MSDQTLTFRNHQIISCRGRVYVISDYILSKSAFWKAAIETLPRPEGYVIDDMHPDVVSLLFSVAQSFHGVEAIEPGLNLVLLLHALWLAMSWGMPFEVEKLELSIIRYVTRRIFHRNPFNADSNIDISYIQYRSSELYRSWQLARLVPAVAEIISPDEIARLWFTLIPQEYYPVLFEDYEETFMNHIRGCAMLSSASGYSVERQFGAYFQSWFERCSYLTQEWLGQGDVTRRCYRQAC
jgi:hypothetical protein